MKTEESYYLKFKKPEPKKPQIEYKDTIGSEMYRTRFRTK